MTRRVQDVPGLRSLVRLAQLRQVRGLSQRKLAELAGTTVRVVGEIERGDRLLKRELGTYLRLAQALGVAVTAILPALDKEPGGSSGPRFPEV